MSALRQGSMVLVKDVDYESVEEQFHEAVFTHASTSPNLQIMSPWTLPGAKWNLKATSWSTAPSNWRSISGARSIPTLSSPNTSKFCGADDMIPGQFRKSGFVDYLTPGNNWAVSLRTLREDEFALDVTRLTLVCGSAGFDGTQFKNMLAADYDIQLNKTSRNSVLLQTNINNTRSDVANLIKGIGRHFARYRKPFGARRTGRAPGLCSSR